VRELDWVTPLHESYVALNYSTRGQTKDIAEETLFGGTCSWADGALARHGRTFIAAIYYEVYMAPPDSRTPSLQSCIVVVAKT
jgi:hypothetical protein